MSVRSPVRVSSTTKDSKHRSGGVQKHPTQVARRNARERNRVRQVNMGFVTLRHHIPYQAKNKKLSKVETLRQAAIYIDYLRNILQSPADSACQQPQEPFFDPNYYSNNNSFPENYQENCFQSGYPGGFQPTQGGYIPQCYPPTPFNPEGKPIHSPSSSYASDTSSQDPSSLSPSERKYSTSLEFQARYS